MLLKNISLKDPLKQAINVVPSFKVPFCLFFMIFINCLVFFEAGARHDDKFNLKLKPSLKKQKVLKQVKVFKSGENKINFPV